MYSKNANFADLEGKTLSAVQTSEDEITFETTDGELYRLTHFQDCCEYVRIESIVGDLETLIGNPILTAEEASNGGSDYGEESTTWTFYKLATIKGYVDIRWIGESNGYYSESVDFVKDK